MLLNLFRNSFVLCAAVGAAIYMTCYLFSRKSRSMLDNLPTIGDKTILHFTEILQEGYKKFPNTPYTIPDRNGKSNTLILPVQFLDEIKSLPETKVSFVKTMETRMEGKYSTFGIHDHAMIASVKVDLTRNIGNTLEGLQDELEAAVPDCIGACNEWTAIPFYSKALRIIARLSARVFVGLPLCRNEEWLQTTIDYTIDCFGVIQPVSKIPALVQPLAALFIPEVQKVREHRARGSRLLKPLLEERLASINDPDFEPPKDMIQFMIQNSGHKAGDPLYQSNTQMFTSLAAIYTTPLRDELEAVLIADNDVLVKTSMTKLRKMDSFMKESQRLNAPSTLACMRQAMSDIQLSTGLTIPKDTQFAFNNIGVNMDPATYNSPEEFDGFRFSKLRDIPGNENKFQFVTTGHNSLNFGHGTHACPGRFFASNETKLILASIIRAYDFKFKEGESRAANHRGSKTSQSPNPMAELLFHKRRF